MPGIQGAVSTWLLEDFDLGAQSIEVIDCKTLWRTAEATKMHLAVGHPLGPARVSHPDFGRRKWRPIVVR